MEGAIVNQLRKLMNLMLIDKYFIMGAPLLPEVPSRDEDNLKDDLPAAIEQPRRSEGDEGAPGKHKLDHVVSCKYNLVTKTL